MCFYWIFARLGACRSAYIDRAPAEMRLKWLECTCCTSIRCNTHGSFVNCGWSPHFGRTPFPKKKRSLRPEWLATMRSLSSNYGFFVDTVCCCSLHFRCDSNTAAAFAMCKHLKTHIQPNDELFSKRNHKSQLVQWRCACGFRWASSAFVLHYSVRTNSNRLVSDLRNKWNASKIHIVYSRAQDRFDFYETRSSDDRSLVERSSLHTRAVSEHIRVCVCM